MQKSGKSSIPVLIIGYARFENILKQIEIIKRFTNGKIYLHLDGGRSNKLVLEQNDFVEELALKGHRVELLQQTRNLGVALGVLSAIDWFFSQEISGLVLEDDLVFDVEGLKFLELSLEFISDLEFVLLATGSTFSLESDEVSQLECKWTNIPLIWGWCTTRVKWRKMRNLILNCQKPSFRDLFSPSLSFFQSGRLRALSQKIDTWDLPLAYMMVHKGFLCLVSPVNYFSNVGNDEHAVHTKDNSFPMFMPISRREPDLNWLCFPEESKVVATNKLYFRHLFKVTPRNILGLLRSLYLVSEIDRLRVRLER